MRAPPSCMWTMGHGLGFRTRTSSNARSKRKRLQWKAVKTWVETTRRLDQLLEIPRIQIQIQIQGSEVGGHPSSPLPTWCRSCFLRLGYCCCCCPTQVRAFPATRMLGTASLLAQGPASPATLTWLAGRPPLDAPEDGPASSSSRTPSPLPCVHTSTPHATAGMVGAHAPQRRVQGGLAICTVVAPAAPHLPI